MALSAGGGAHNLCNRKGRGVASECQRVGGVISGAANRRGEIEGLALRASQDLPILNAGGIAKQGNRSMTEKM